MSFLGVGAGEALLIFILILLLVGPNRFPEVMRQAARWYKIARGFSSEVMRDVRAAVDEIETEVNSETEDLRSVRDLADMREELEDDFSRARRDVDEAGQETEQAARSSTESLDDRAGQRASTNGASSAPRSNSARANSGRANSSRSSRLLRHTRENPKPGDTTSATDGESATTPEDAERPAASRTPRRSIRPDRNDTRRPTVKRDSTLDEEDPFAALEARRAAANQQREHEEEQDGSHQS